MLTKLKKKNVINYPFGIFKLNTMFIRKLKKEKQQQKMRWYRELWNRNLLPTRREFSWNEMGEI